MTESEAGKYNGYSLFEDVEDKEIQLHNRSQVILNMLYDGTDERTGKVSMNAMRDVFQYLSYFDTDTRREIGSKSLPVWLEVRNVS